MVVIPDTPPHPLRIYAFGAEDLLVLGPMGNCKSENRTFRGTLMKGSLAGVLVKREQMATVSECGRVFLQSSDVFCVA